MRVRARILLPLGGAFAIMPLVYLLLPRSLVIPDSVGDHSGWSPTAVEIESRIGRGGGRYDDARHVEFAKAFQQRFRSHYLAIGARFTGEGRIRLKCGAMVPRWDMASVAMELKKEADDIFDGNYDIDIYETYIANIRKLGELRTRADGKMVVDFTVEYPYIPLLGPDRPVTPFRALPTDRVLTR
jgi:hypothetical protein